MVQIPYPMGSHGTTLNCVVYKY